MAEPRTVSRLSLRNHAIVGIVALGFLVFGLGGWAVTTDLAGAVVASGVLVVDTNIKKVQHPTGGVVSELRVKDGDRVRFGDLLIRLDETVAGANLAIVVKSLNELAARQARLEAERDDAASVGFPETLALSPTSADTAQIMRAEQKLFELRRTSRMGQKSQLRERIEQMENEIQGIAGQVEAKRGEIALIKVELEGARELWAKKLIPISRLTALEREALRLEGERGQLVAAIAQSRGKIAETGLQIIQIDQDLRSEVAKESREIQARTAELVERKVAAEDQLRRIEVRAPQEGTVHQLSVHTVGGVIGAGEALMFIVPESDDLTVEVKVPPQNIDQLAIGQQAVLRFSAFNQRTTPEIIGMVARIGADLTQDSRTGAAFFSSRITMQKSEIERLNGLKLVPGMPLEAFIQTGMRSALSYLTKPLFDQVQKAFRER